MERKPQHCPLCGAAVGVERVYWDKATRSVIGNGYVRTLTPKQARLFELLWPPTCGFTTAETLARCLFDSYYVSPHGGVPRVSSMVKRMRPLLAPLNIQIEGCRARDRGGFRIVVIKPLAARQQRPADRSAHMGFMG